MNKRWWNKVPRRFERSVIRRKKKFRGGQKFKVEYRDTLGECLDVVVKLLKKKARKERKEAEAAKIDAQ